MFVKKSFDSVIFHIIIVVSISARLLLTSKCRKRKFFIEENKTTFWEDESLTLRYADES